MSKNSKLVTYWKGKTMETVRCSVFAMLGTVWHRSTVNFPRFGGYQEVSKETCSCISHPFQGTSRWWHCGEVVTLGRLLPALPFLYFLALSHELLCHVHSITTDWPEVTWSFPLGCLCQALGHNANNIDWHWRKGRMGRFCPVELSPITDSSHCLLVTIHWVNSCMNYEVCR